MLALRLALLLLAASIGLVYGFVTSFRKFVQLDNAEDPESALSWHEGPFRALFLDLSQGLTVALKDLTVLVMASLLLVCAVRYDDQELSAYENDRWQTWAIVISAAQVGLTWWMAALPLVGLVTGLSKRRVRVALSPAGISWGGAHLPWTSFSYFDSESSPPRFRLYSAYSPDLCTTSVAPPEDISWERAASIIARNLPDAGRINPTRTKRRIGRYYIENLGLCVAGLLLSILLFRFSTLWSQFLQMVLVLLFVQTSSAVARRYLFAGAPLHTPDSQQ